MTKHARINHNTSSGKLSYILQVIFPPLSSLKETYLYLRKNPYLIVVTWVSRWIRLLFKKTKSSLIKIRRLFVRNKDINYLIEIYEKMGI